MQSKTGDPRAIATAVQAFSLHAKKVDQLRCQQQQYAEKEMMDGLKTMV